MEPVSQPNLVLKSALFVDFDNIYIGLSKNDPLAAERFASDPARWLAWLEQGLPATPGSMLNAPGAESRGQPVPCRRSILIRRCYPNPDAGFRRYRSFFTSAAFSVIDCPTLTRTGKNSSDIYMVMDILDILNHKTYFDEFIIFSGDSDFMPVLLRLRAHDRRTTTLAIDFMPPAFKAACDLVISEEEFIEDALGIASEGQGSSILRARLEMPVLKEMAHRVFETARQDGEVAGADLPDILKDFREFRESSNWLGFGTSQRLAEALAHLEPRLNLTRVNAVQYKLMFKSHGPSAPVEPARAPAREPVESRPVTPTPIAGEEPPDFAAMRKQIAALVQELVCASDSAVLLARASQFVLNRMGQRVLETQWAGTGSFKKLLMSMDDLGLEITSQPEPGYIFDAQRHTHPAQRGPRRPPAAPEGEAAPAEKPQPVRRSYGGYPGEFSRRENQPYPLEVVSGEMEVPLPSLDEFARRVSQVTGAPLLSVEQYALVFNGIYAEMQKISEGQKTYNTYQSAKAVSDWCAERGSPVSHSDIALIFKGIIFQDGVRFGKQPGSYLPADIAQVIRDNVQALCQRARLELSENECAMLDTWILSGLQPAAPSLDPQEPEKTLHE